MERLLKRVNEWLNRTFESLGVDPKDVDEMFEEYPSNESSSKEIEIRTTQFNKGFCRSIQDLLSSERDDADFEKIDLVVGMEGFLSLHAGNRQRTFALVHMREALEYYYTNPHILEIGIAKDDAAIAAAELKRQRKADRLRKQMKVAS
jgi:hypothetical protein